MAGILQEFRRYPLDMKLLVLLTPLYATWALGSWARVEYLESVVSTAPIYRMDVNQDGIEDRLILHREIVDDPFWPGYKIVPEIRYGSLDAAGNRYFSPEPPQRPTLDLATIQNDKI